MKPFRETQAFAIDPMSLQHEMEVHGYVLIRNLLPPEALHSLLCETTHILRTSDWLVPGSDPLDRLADSNAAVSDDDPQYKEVTGRVFGLQSFHALPHHPLLRQLMQHLVGPDVLVHPKSVPRLIFPNHAPAVMRAHQDHGAVAGDTESFTAWIPLHYCPCEQGTLRILEGSHRFGFQPTLSSGFIDESAVTGGEWVSGDLHAGDVLLFHSLTVHAATPNTSQRLRLSLDCRFQSSLRPINPAALVFTGSSSRSWDDIYSTWPPSDLKFYWTHLPITLKPSLAELAELAETADSPRLRQRHSRILDRISSQIAPRANVPEFASSATTSGLLPTDSAKCILWILMACATISVIFYTEIPLLHRPQELARLHLLRWILIPHAVAGTFAFLSGPFQFSNRLRRRSPRFHRLLGRLYVSAVVIAAPLAILSTAWANYLHPLYFRVAIAVQGSAWLATTLTAFVLATQRRIPQHRQWMLRSYAVTFTFILTRVLQPIPGWNRLGRFRFAAAIVLITIAATLVPEIARGIQTLTRSLRKLLLSSAPAPVK